MVHISLKRSRNGVTDFESRAPAHERAAPPSRPLGRTRAAARRGPRGPIPTVFAAVAGCCALATCALALPGLVLGAEASPSAEERVEQTLGVSPDSAAEVLGTASGPTSSSRDAAGPVGPTEAIRDLPAHGDLLVTLPWGSGPGQVGRTDSAEGLARGPEALAVAPDGRIAILDSVNHRLLLLGPSGKTLGTVSVPLEGPRFLAVDDQRLHVLDCDSDRQLLTFDWNGRELSTAYLPEQSDVVTGLFATNQGPCVEVLHETVLLIAEGATTVEGVDAAGSQGSRGEVLAQAAREDPSPDRTGQPRRSAWTKVRELAGRPAGRDLAYLVQATYERGQGVRIKSVELDAGTLEPVQTSEFSPSVTGGPEIDHLVSVDGDGAGGLIVGARLVEPQTSLGRKASLVITRLVPNHCYVRSGSTVSSAASLPSGSTAEALGTTESLYLPDQSSIYLGQPYIVTPGGRVLQPWADEAGYSILLYSFTRPAEVE